MFLQVSRYALFCICVNYHLKHHAHCQSTILSVINNTIPSRLGPSRTMSYYPASLLSHQATRALINATMSYNGSRNTAGMFNVTAVRSYNATKMPSLNGTVNINSTINATSVNATIGINKNSSRISDVSIWSSIGSSTKLPNLITSVSATPSKVLTVASSLVSGSFNSSPCFEKERWKKSVYDDNTLCLTRACTRTMLDLFDLYMTCNDKTDTLELQVIGGYVNKFLILRADEMITPLGPNPIKRTFVRVTKNYFKTEYGFIRRRFLTRSSPIAFPHHSFGEEKTYLMPPTVVNAEVVSFVYTDFFDNIYKHDEAVDYAEEITPLTEALYLLDGGEDISSVANVINSKIISVLTRPTVDSYTEYVDIFFTYRDYKGTINHKCAHAPGHLAQVTWTNAGCYAITVQLKTIHCRCDTPTSNFAVLSELYVPPKAQAAFVQSGLARALVIIGAVGVFVCFLCLILPPCVGCSYIGGMIRIYRYSDLTQAVTYVIFIIGVYSSRHETASSLIAVVLHFLMCSVMFWALVEGIYLYHKIKPQYHRSTGTMFFYSTVVFGISAALTGAASGYTFLFGTNIQYVWPKAHGLDIIYLFVPVFIMVLITIAIDWMLILQLKNWIGFHDDYVYTRAPYFIRRQSGFVGVCIVMHVTGTLSMKTDGTGSMAYFFAAFFVIQIMCRFYSHFVWNYEVWEWRKFNEFNVMGGAEKKKGVHILIDYEEVERQHTIMRMESSSSDGSASEESLEAEHRSPERPHSSQVSECQVEKLTSPDSTEDALNAKLDEDDGSIEVERVHLRPSSVHFAAPASISEVEERIATPQTTEVAHLEENKVKTVKTKIKTMDSEESEESDESEEEEEESDGEGGKIRRRRKKKKRKKFKVKDAAMPRMTKAQLARMQKLEDEKKKEEEEAKKLEKRLTRKQSKMNMDGVRPRYLDPK